MFSGQQYLASICVFLGMLISAAGWVALLVTDNSLIAVTTIGTGHVISIVAAIFAAAYTVSDTLSFHPRVMAGLAEKKAAIERLRSHR